MRMSKSGVRAGSIISYPNIPARYIAILCEFLDSIHVCSDDILPLAGLDRKRLEQPKQTVTSDQMALLLSEAGRISGRKDLAFELGSRIKPNSHDILSLALMSSASLDQLLQLYARYYRLITPLFTMNYLRCGDNATLIVRPAMPMKPGIQRQYLEIIAVSVHMQIRSALQTRPSSYSIHVPLEAPPYQERYRELGLAKFHFSPSPQSEIRIQINDAHLDVQLPLANAPAINLAEERCKIMLGNITKNASWSECICAILEQAEGHQPTLPDLAKIMNVTPRTLDRYLEKENITFRDLSVRVRNQRARALLDDGRMSISQIAYTLGYSDLANFSRSFKKVSGVCPSEYKGECKGRPGRRAA
jgi:AraC-like DNA-binding protein